MYEKDKMKIFVSEFLRRLNLFCIKNDIDFKSLLEEYIYNNLGK